MTHSINLLEQSIHENKVKLQQADKKKEQLIGELTVLHLAQGNLQSSIDQMESELKAQYDRERYKFSEKSTMSTQDSCTAASPYPPEMQKEMSKPATGQSGYNKQ